MDWLKKLAGYAPDIAAAVATGGGSLAATGLRILGKELLGTEHASESEVREAVMNASPEQMVQLQRINNEFKLEKMRIENADKQSEHKQTQETIRNGDNSSSAFVRFTRPGQSWLSLIGAMYYALFTQSPDVTILGALLTLPFTYAGLRQFGKWKTADSLMNLNAKK